MEVISVCCLKKDEPFVGLWWLTEDQHIIGVTKPRCRGANKDGSIFYSKYKDHMTLWKTVLYSNMPTKEAKAIYNKGFRSLYRGHVNYNMKKDCYEIFCSRNIINNKAFRQKVVDRYKLDKVRYEFKTMYDYEEKLELTGNSYMDEFYYHLYSM